MVKLNDCLQLTKRDASHYNKMLTRVPILEDIDIHRLLLIMIMAMQIKIIIVIHE